jgi:hypothetical protein
MDIVNNEEFEFSNSKDKFVYYMRINSFKPLDNNPDSFNKNNFTKPIFVPIPMKYVIIDEQNEYPCIKKRKINNI